MRVEVVHPNDLGIDEVERWRGLQKANPTLGNPFLSPDYTLAVGRARKTARVGVLTDGGEVVGFFPHERRGRLLGTVIGAGISDCQGIIHAPGLELDGRELVRACGLPVWEFDHLIADQVPFAPFHIAQIGSPVMDLSAGYPAYVDERNRANGAIKTVHRKMRKLAREVGELRFEYQATDERLLRLLMDWKSAQYQRTRVHDRFATPWIVRTVTELFATRSPECTGTLSVLYAGDRPVAAHFGIRSESTLSYWFPAYDPEFSRYSAGLGLLLQMAEAAAESGAEQVDLGRGSTRYKDELKTGELRIAEGRVGVSWPATTIRSAQGAMRHGVYRIRRRRPLRHVRRLARFVRGVASR
jgi:CelD/BcsL family acetyltransferase involved in cellulose biosynthesis